MRIPKVAGAVLLPAAIVLSFAGIPFGGRRAAAPVVPSPESVVDGATMDASRGIGSGAWVSIFGTNLAPRTRAWSGSDFLNGVAPTQLEGVSVLVNGKPAYVAFLLRGADVGIGYDQINILTPPDDAPGPLSVVVRTPEGQSAAVSVRKAAPAPALFPFEPEGRKYLAASTADGVEYIGKANLFGSARLERPIRPARAGEVITFYGSGFGAVDPPVPAGSIPGNAASLVRPVTVRFGETAVKVLYAGVAPSLAGVYQFNVLVPNLAPGEHEVTVEIDGVRSPGRFLVINEAPVLGLDHGQVSNFRLTGAHVFVECQNCHVRGLYLGTPTACVACHLPRYEATSAPNHAASGFPKDCAGCHTTSSFQGAMDHTKTRFQLSGKHATLPCLACHTNGQFAGLGTACINCHQASYDQAPNHVAGAYPKDCAVCHTPAGFAGAKVDHSRTAFPLTGAHSALACTNCHGDGIYAGRSTACVSCHLSSYEKAPNHVNGSYPRDCAVCHTTTAFAGAKIDHSRTKLPLTGKHATLQCSSCHSSGVYTGLKSDCASCHLSRYDATTAPNHRTSGYPTDCAMCHTPAGWPGATVSHTRFALTGKHQQTQCLACHTSGVFTGTPRDCAGCHLTAYNATRSPDHRTAGFPTDCALCHSTTQFPGARFVHARFSLTGAHTSLACSSCHSDGQYAGKPAECANCHLPRYNATTNPNHAASGFPTTCATCHTTSQWKGATFTHSKFALTGKHVQVQCSSCHVNGQYAGTSTACANCHLPRYNATTNPNHVASGFPTTCNTCHTTSGWPDATFTHSRFALTGKHVQVQCSSCHVSGQYAGTPTACANCHLPRYNATTNPNHAAAGFPTTCNTCHTTSGWPGATFTHKFPIYSGAHRNRWSSCQTCHVDPANFATFSCLGCHTKSGTDSDHRGVSGYGYDSQSCYRCHPNGRKP